MPDPILQVAAGRTFRFQVKHTELGNGSSWSLTSHRQTGDIYVAHREGGRWIKSSYHESGQWHFGLGSAAVARDQNGDRYLAVTHTHRKVAPGWVHALRIAVPRSELRHHTEAVIDRKVFPVVLPWGHDAVAIDLYLGMPGHPRAIQLNPLNRVLAVLERGDGGGALLISRPLALLRPIADEYAAEIREARQGLIEQGWDGQPTRIVIFGMVDPQGPHHELEVAIDPPN